MNEMMERIARSIKTKAWSIDLPLRDEECADLARAAIEPMGEPTEEMVKAGTISWDPMDGGPIRPVFEPTKPYQAMIRAALR